MNSIDDNDDNMGYSIVDVDDDRDDDSFVLILPLRPLL